uniref:Uncharacterized protein n=1 Tax=Hucho hucho TaxID=62062 RepID=A0A4W5QGH2_9TELE
MLQEHYEAVMRRTLERSQRVEQRQKRWSWGGISESDNRPGDPDAGASSPVAIVISPASPEKPPRTQADKRSTSTMNLKQPADSGINRRLSSSSATLIKSPDKKCHLCPRSASASPLHLMQRGPVRSRSIDRQKSTTLPTSASADQLNPSLVRHHESGRHMKT